MSTNVKPAGFHFLVSTNVDKPDPDLRKFIRQHVMQGKNKGKTPRPSTKPRKKRGRKNVPLESSDELLSHDLNENRCKSVAVVPPKFGATWSSARLDGDVDPGSVEIVLQLSALAKRLLFPLEPCILFERRAEDWIAPLATDPVYLHTMIFGARYYFHSIKSHGSMRVDPHFVTALRLLRERIEGEDEELKISLPTIAAMMSLAGHALMMGDLEIARSHLYGLFKIMALRGGVSACMENPKLVLEVFRVDIGVTLQSGLPTIFSQNSPSRTPIPYPNLKPFLDACGIPGVYVGHALNDFIDSADPELSRVWRILSDFSLLINSITESKQRISTMNLLQTTSSVMYRLISMTFELGSANEAVRLSMLAFCSSIFLQWRRFGLPYTHLASQLQDCLSEIDPSSMPPRFWLWILMMSTISVFEDSHHGWIRPLLATNASLSSVDSWDQIRQLLGDFIWIRMVHDKPGKVAFDSMIKVATAERYENGMPVIGLEAL